MLPVVLTRLMENRLIYFPPRFPEGFDPSPTAFSGLESVWIKTSDGVKLNAFYFASSTRAKTLLCFHGNAENIAHGLAQWRDFSGLGLNVLALDYRGYGRSEGSPDERGVYCDAEAAYAYLVGQRDIKAMDIVLYGRSLGGAVAIDLAAQRHCGGLIIESSFTSGRSMARRAFPIPFFEYVPKSRFDSLDKIKRIRSPILIMHGTHDTVVPHSMGQQLYQTANEPKYFFAINGAEHNDVYDVGGFAYLERIKQFIMSLPKSSPSPVIP